MTDMSGPWRIAKEFSSYSGKWCYYPEFAEAGWFGRLNWRRVEGSAKYVPLCFKTEDEAREYIKGMQSSTEYIEP